MALSAEYIRQQFLASEYEVARESFTASSEPVDNLIATLPGTSQADRIVILGAHYDSTPTTPGADDNASAVAVLIEAARLLRRTRMRRSVRFVAFACEESPYFFTREMGSQVHASACRDRRENVIAMLCLEMVGYFTTEAGSQEVPPGIPRWLRWAFPSRGNFLAAVGNPRSWRLCWSFRRGFKRATKFPLFSIVLPESIPEIHLSDHRSFWEVGYPALMLTDTSFLRSPNYHRVSDTPETLDYDRMVDVTLGVAGAIKRLAGLC